MPNQFATMKKLLSPKVNGIDWTQDKLAARSGVGKKAINSYLAGKPKLDVFKVDPDHVAQLALVLDEPVEAWFSELKLAMPKGIERLAAEKLRRKRVVAGLKPELPPLYTLHGRVLANLRRDKRFRVSVTKKTLRHSTAFDEGYVSLLCSLINHRWSPPTYERNTETDEAQLQLVLSREFPVHMAAGFLETLDRKSMGLSFVHYPGIRHTVNAVQVGSGVRNVSWTDVRHLPKDIIALTTTGGTGDAYLRGLWSAGVNPGIIHTIDPHSLTDLGGELEDLIKDHPRKPIIYCGVEDVCVGMLREPGLSSLKLRMVPDGKQNSIRRPLYLAGLAVLHDPEWVALLREGTEFAFRTAPDRLATLYADLLIKNLPTDQPLGHGLASAKLFDLNLRDSEDFLGCLETTLRSRLEQLNLGKKYDPQGIIKEMLEGARTLRQREGIKGPSPSQP